MADLRDPNPLDALPTVLLDRYCAGRASAAELAAVEQWCAEHPEGRTVLKELREGITRAEFPPLMTEQRRDVARQILAEYDAHGLAVSGARRGSITQSPSVRLLPASVPRRWSGMLAGIATGVAAVIGLVMIHRAGGFAFLSATSRGTMASTVYTTAIAQRASVTLGDGTRVTLGPQSTLRVSAGFGGASRTLTLIGEAFFDVKHATGAPFVVQTGSVETRVLGTSFDVRRYADDTHAQIAVTAGKVAVASSGHQHAALTLTAGAIGIATDSTVSLVSSDSARSYTTWTSEQLIFHGVAMPEVLATLTRWYGYRFRLADSALADRTLTAALDAQSSAGALNTIKLLLNVDLTFDGDIVTLHARRVTPTRRNAGRETFSSLQTEVGR